MPIQNTFSKAQRLKSRKKLQEVFSAGKSVRGSVVKLVFLTEKTDVPEVQCGVGLITRNFKNAVDRNRIKRLLREAYRLQQQPLQAYIASSDTALSAFLLYTGRELPNYQTIYENVEVALQKLLKTLHAANSQNT